MRGKIKVAKTARNRLRKLSEHPLAPPSGIVAVSRMVLFEKIGAGSHSCHWCGSRITWRVRNTTNLNKDDLVADHLNWDRTDDSPENLVPSCPVCNAHRTRANDQRLIAEDELTVMWGNARTRAVQRFCNICGKPFLTIPAEVKKGKGRFCSRSCARKAKR